MKLVIFGSRDVYPTPDEISSAIRLLSMPDGSTVKEHKITEVVCGGARGADEAGSDWAKLHDIPVRYFPANWNALGKRAGHVRNKIMAEYCDQGLGFWRNESGGTANMVTQLVVASKSVYVKVV